MSEALHQQKLIDTY